MVKNILNLDIKKNEKFDATDALEQHMSFLSESNNQTLKAESTCNFNPEKLI